MMFDPLKNEKAKLHQAKVNADLARKYSCRQLVKAKNKSKRFLSSPTGISAMFAAGAINGVVPSTPTPSSSTMTSLLLKFF